MERKAAALAGEPVAKHMRTHFISAGPDDSLLEADRIMRLARIRHLPVVRKGALIGLLSHRDVLSASIAKLQDCEPAQRLDYLRGIKIQEVMSRDLATATEETTLGAAAQRMLRLKIGCLPVVRGGPNGPSLVGILTESDLLRAAYAPDFEGASD
ncbi:MAG TPA: CBS domain-containing protein [Myxococcota bacterium]|nr:CBS domain-containing protein [Myxococcota bacterium]